jgi:hypothetical protein
MQKTLGDNFKGRIFVLGKADVGAYRNKRNKPYSHYEISRIGFHTLQGTDSQSSCSLMCTVLAKK